MKKSAQILKELKELYNWVDDSFKNYTDHQLIKLAERQNEPRFYSLVIIRRQEEMELKEKRRKFFSKK